LNQHFENALRRFAPERIAFGIERTGVSFAELAATVERFTDLLRQHGVIRDTVVGYSLPNCVEVLPLLLAISRLGARAVPLYPMMPEHTRVGVFAALGCSLVILPACGELGQAAQPPQSQFRTLSLETLVTGASAARVPTISSEQPSQPFLAAASSGTTGAPKTVWMTQANASAVLTASAELAQLGTWQGDPDFTSVAAFPLSTSSVLVVLGMILSGARMILARDLSPAHLLLLAQHWQAEAISAPPAYFEAILNLPTSLRPALPAVRAIFSGMDFLHSGLVSRLCEYLPNLDRAASGYGLVETSTVFMCWKAHDREAMKHPANVFTLCPGLDNSIDVRDEHGRSLGPNEAGELWAKGDSVVSGYLGGGAANAAAFVDGWFRTGDVASLRDERTIELLGRRKYLIKRAGKSVAPTEVQERLDACEGVRESAVVGVKHPLYGEMIWAFVVADPQSPATLKDLMKASRASLPNYMVPDQVTFVKELPRGAGVGKLDREALIRMASQELATTVGESLV
jgi:long-chain acyl-CoA synthetase